MFLFSVYSSAFLFVLGLLSIGADLYYFLSAILESSDFISLFSCDYLSVYVYVGFAEVYLRFSRGCVRVPRSGGGSVWVPVPFVVYPASCRGGWFHTTEVHLPGVL